MPKYDVLIWDDCGPQYGLETVVGIGGSEHAVIRLAKALGKRMTVYLAATRHALPQGISCKNLIVQRTSTVPAVPYEKLLVWAHDSHAAAQPNGAHTLVCLSHWQAGHMPAPANRTFAVIPSMLPDTVYRMCRAPREYGRFLYASAACKGWDATYERWRAVRRPGDTLRVLDSGYDKAKRYDDRSLVYLPPLTEEQLIREIATAEGLFMVNTMAENCPATYAMADALGTPIFSSHPKGEGGVPEILTRNSTFGARDFRISTILPRWLEILK